MHVSQHRATSTQYEHLHVRSISSLNKTDNLRLRNIEARSRSH